MSAPSVVVIPAQGNCAHQPEQDPSELASTIQEALNERTRRGEKGPLKELISRFQMQNNLPRPQSIALTYFGPQANQGSLYKYINWEDPARTLGSYFAAMSILFGAHYLPLTRWVVEIGAATFGVVSITEFVSRKFGSDTFLARLRPREYKTVPEPTLNATLRDIHDFVQYAVVEVQKIIYGQDLGKAFAAFISFTTLSILLRVASPFSLAVLGLTSLYIAPLISSPQGRAVARSATEQGKELANTAAEKAGALAEDSKAKAADLTSKTRETVVDAKQSANELAAHTKDRVEYMAESGRQSTNELAANTRDRVSEVSRATPHNAANLRDLGVDAIHKAPAVTKLSSIDAEHYNSRPVSSTNDGVSGNYRYDTRGAAKNASQYSGDVYDTPRQMASPGTTNDRTLHRKGHLEDTGDKIAYRSY
ncbi:reticulon 1 Cwl1 [Fusarium heterosporum]|uniref:Reticulon 1 Cwl1 n=1 Tax=Fusarium heterosporum TaxID=42747 RepID=A0A8H5U269_FUSHE|nr:reticulon 1 Cwl1 [Fusarium heterosporum]